MQSLITLTCLVFTSIKLSIADSIIKYLFSDFLIIASLLIVLIGSKQVYDIPWGKRLYFCDFFNAYFEFHHKIAQLNKTKEVSPCLWTIFDKIFHFLVKYDKTFPDPVLWYTLKGRIYWIRLHAGPDIFPPTFTIQNKLNIGHQFHEKLKNGLLPLTR